MKILLTGFEAFGDVEENPTQVIVEQFAQQIDSIDYADLICEIIPVEYDLSGERIRELIDKHRPDAVVMTGVAAGREKINIEFWARNNRTAKIPDNSGVLLTNQPINPDEPTEHFLPSTLPVFALYSKLHNAQIPVERSNSAGGYICNNIFYSAVEYLKKCGREDVLAGFVHIPTFEKIDQQTMKRAYDVILRKVAESKLMQNLEAHMYMNPAIECELQNMLEKLPDKPSWIALVTTDGLNIGFVGQPMDLDRVSVMTAAVEALSQRVSEEINNSLFSSTIVCGEKGIFYVLELNPSYTLAINWDDATSLGTPYMASKMFPQFLQPLRDLLAL